MYKIEYANDIKFETLRPLVSTLQFLYNIHSAKVWSESSAGTFRFCYSLWTKKFFWDNDILVCFLTH